MLSTTIDGRITHHRRLAIDASVSLPVEVAQISKDAGPRENSDGSDRTD